MPKYSQDGKSHAQSQEEKDHWIFIINNEAVDAYSADGDIQPSMCKLRHPRLDSGVMYLFSANFLGIYEVNCCEEKYRSWFIGNSVLSGGRIYITSQVDPLFLVLPYLVKVGQRSSQFMTLDQLICDEDYPDCHKLLTCCNHDQMALIADWKDLDDNVQVYQYSQEKTLSWLKIKTETLAQALEHKKVSVDVKGSHSAIFARSKHAATSKDAYIEYAHGIISDYLSSDLQKELRQFLKLPDVTDSQTENEPPNKKTKLTDVLSPTDDYSRNVNLKKDKSLNGKLTSAQKKLGKVDKTGMKSISSFFSKNS